MKKLIPLLVIAGIIALCSYAYTAYKQSKYWMTGPVIISVSGEGEVQARPDVGQFSFGVRAEGEDAATAQSASAASLNAIIDYLEEAGVADADIETDSYNLNPRYRYEERICPAGSYCPPGEQIIDGYEVYQNVTVKVRSLEESGTLISGVGERGATNISGLSFAVDDTDALEEEARALAIADAQGKAERLAEKLGVKIVRMTGYYETGKYPVEPYGYGGDMMFDRAMSEAAVPEMPVGEEDIRVTLDISYEVK